MAQKIQASTQKFTEIIDFVDNIVLLQGGAACAIIELTASNFSLLSSKERDARIYAYAGFLNSLSFPIQILIRNKLIDISSYLNELDEKIKSSKNENLSSYIEDYRGFIKEILSINVVLSKSFYIIIPFSSLEAGMSGATQIALNNKAQFDEFVKNAQKNLETKINSLFGQLQKFAVTAKVLYKEDLIKLFYEIYNEGSKIETEHIEQGLNTKIVKGGR